MLLNQEAERIISHSSLNILVHGSSFDVCSIILAMFSPSPGSLEIAITHDRPCQLRFDQNNPLSFSINRKTITSGQRKHNFPFFLLTKESSNLEHLIITLIFRGMSDEQYLTKQGITWTHVRVLQSSTRDDLFPEPGVNPV